MAEKNFSQMDEKMLLNEYIQLRGMETSDSTLLHYYETELFRRYRGLIHKEAKQYAYSNYHYQDVVADGYILFCRALRMYHTGSQASFFTYLKTALKNGWTSQSNCWRTIYYSETAGKHYRLVHRAAETVAIEDKSEHNSSVSVPHLSMDEKVGQKLSQQLSLQQIYRALNITPHCSLEDSIKDSEGKSISLAQTIPDDTPSPISDVVLKEKQQKVREILKQYSQTDRNVIYDYFGEGLNRESIARKYGLTLANVRQILNRFRQTERKNIILASLI